MSANIHRVLMAIGGIAAGLGGVSGGSDIIDPQLGAWIAFVGGCAILVANTIRVYWPDSKESA